MKPKHTPAPWVQSVNYDYTIVAIDDQGFDKHICRYEVSAATEEVDLANARLIKAAPELLEALELILVDNRLMNALSRDQAKAVMYSIAKARGES